MMAMSWRHEDLSPTALRVLLKEGCIKLAGNVPGKIMGRLDCRTGKRMLRHNRIFFGSPVVGSSLGYRPCGTCCRESYELRAFGKPWFAKFCEELSRGD